MPYKILILGASYGSLLGTKLIAAGHDVSLVCRDETASLINSEGTEVRIKLRDEDTHRCIFSGDLPGNLNALTPENTHPQDYDLVCLAMQEPQYSHSSLTDLLSRTAAAKVPCMSIMNMPPLPYLRRIPGLDGNAFKKAFLNAEIWARFDPELMTLCSPDPQAFRPVEDRANVLHVGLPTNFKVSKYSDPALNTVLETLAKEIDAYRIDGKDVPVKLRVYDSLFVPFAKWAMLATGNYRCVTRGAPQSIRDAVHGDIERSREIYDYVNAIVEKLGADSADLVPFEKYAAAANNLLKASSAARAIEAGAIHIERVDKLIMLTAEALDMSHPAISDTVAVVDLRLLENAAAAV